MTFKWFDWRRRYFRNKKRGVEKMILDLQFKRFKTREIREEVRQQYDMARSKMAVLEDTIRKQLKDPTKICEVHNPEIGKPKKLRANTDCTCDRTGEMPSGDVDRLYDQKELLELEIQKYKGQMDSMDLDINGSKPTNEYPEGVVGITQQIDSLEELKLMIRDYIKRI